MAVCPKCNGKLKITDWRPNCPHCGVNIVYYGMEERLLLDADKAEAEHAHFQKRIDRLKSAYTASKLSIIRIILSVLPIPALLLPLAKVSFNAPFVAQETTVNAIAFYNLFSGTDFGAIFTLIGSDVLGKTFLAYAVALVSIVLSLLMVLLHLILLMLSCSPKGKSRNFTLNILSIVFAVVSCISFSVFSSSSSAALTTNVISSSIGFGIFVYIATLILCVIINVLVFKKNVPVKYKQCFVGGIPSEDYFKLVDDGVPVEQIRAEMAKRSAEKEAAALAEAQAKAQAEETEEKKDEATVK